MCPHQNSATLKQIIQDIISAYREGCFHQVKFDSDKKQSKAEPKSAKARAAHSGQAGGVVPGDRRSSGL